MEEKEEDNKGTEMKHVRYTTGLHLENLTGGCGGVATYMYRVIMVCILANNFQRKTLAKGGKWQPQSQNETLHKPNVHVTYTCNIYMYMYMYVRVHV